MSRQLSTLDICTAVDKANGCDAVGAARIDPETRFQVATPIPGARTDRFADERTVQYIGKLTYQEARVRQFSEQSLSSTALTYGAQKREAMQFSLGWQAAGNWGRVRPWGRATWEYDAKADDRTVSATPMLLGGTYTVGAYTPDDNYFLFNAGAAMDFAGFTAFLSGSAIGGKSDGDYYAVTLGVRIPLQ